MKGFLGSNVAFVVSAIMGMLTFCGYGYYYTYLAVFGLKPGLLEISNIEMIVFGSLATITAITKLIATKWLYFLIEILVLSLGLVLFFVVSKRLKLRERFSEAAKSRSFAIGNCIDQMVKMTLLAAAIFLASFSGFEAGRLDGQAIKKIQPRRDRCYYAGDKIINGVLIAQDKSLTVVFAQQGTFIFRSDDLKSVRSCPSE